MAVERFSIQARTVVGTVQKVQFFAIERWAGRYAEIGLERCSGLNYPLPIGTALFSILPFRHTSGGGGTAAVAQEIETEVSGEEVKASWTYEHGEEDRRNPSAPEEALPSAAKPGGQQLPGYVAEVRVEGYPLPALSGLLTLKSTLTIGLNKSNGEGIAKAPYVVEFANGEVRTGTLDQNGRAELEDVPPCKHEVEWPECPEVQRSEKAEG